MKIIGSFWEYYEQRFSSQIANIKHAKGIGGKKNSKQPIP